MSGGLPDLPPGLEPGAPRPKRSPSAGAVPSTRSTTGLDFTRARLALAGGRPGARVSKPPRPTQSRP
eukprot:1432229-Alexandrium_andersonii.AAC.1